MSTLNVDTKMSYAKGVEEQQPWPLFLDNIKSLAQSKPDDEAFVFVSTDKEREREVITWNELYRKSVMVANALVATGIKQGEVVAICIRTCPEWLYMAFGAMYMGALPVNLAFTYKDGSDVIAFMERLGNCSFIAFDPGHVDENWTIFKSLVDEFHVDGNVRSKRMPFLRYVVAHHPDRKIEGLKQLKDWYMECHPEVPLPNIGPEDTAFLFQTSGSTGIAKIIAHRHKTLPSWNGLFKMMDTQIILNDRPFGWLGGFPLSVGLGTTRVTTSGFSPPPTDRAGFIIDTIRTEKCDAGAMLPPMLNELLVRQEKSGMDKPLLRSVLTGGQPLATSIANSLGKVCERIVMVYGGTEIAIIACHAQTEPGTYQEALCGKPFPEVEVKIVDDDGTTVPANDCGQIYVRTPYLMKEIYGDPEKTANVIPEDGWFKTGDIGRINEDGQLFADGRKSNEIIRGGMNIAAESLEAVMRRCPDIEQVIVVPVPHPVLYQLICACIILKKDSRATEDDIRKYCNDVHADQQRVFSYLPDHYMIVDSFPETSTGKASRLSLANIARGKFEGQTLEKGT